MSEEKLFALCRARMGRTQSIGERRDALSFPLVSQLPNRAYTKSKYTARWGGENVHKFLAVLFFSFKEGKNHLPALVTPSSITPTTTQTRDRYT